MALSDLLYSVSPPSIKTRRLRWSVPIYLQEVGNLLLRDLFLTQLPNLLERKPPLTHRPLQLKIYLTFSAVKLLILGKDKSLLFSYRTGKALYWKACGFCFSVICDASDDFETCNMHH